MEVVLDMAAGAAGQDTMGAGWEEVSLWASGGEARFPEANQRRMEGDADARDHTELDATRHCVRRRGGRCRQKVSSFGFYIQICMQGVIGASSGYGARHYHRFDFTFRINIYPLTGEIKQSIRASYSKNIFANVNPASGSSLLPRKSLVRFPVGFEADLLMAQAEKDVRIQAHLADGAESGHPRTCSTREQSRR